MSLSPGVELAWSLAGRETVLARKQDVEPDHFFCALLKLAEMSDGDLERVAAALETGTRLREERDALRKALTQRSVANTAQTRREVRRAAGRGNAEPKIEELHRSEASRKLFERASGIAPKGLLDCSVLLEALLASPTPAMVRAMGAGGGPATAPIPGEPATASPATGRYVRALPEIAGGGGLDAPPACGPQVKVLAGLLASPERTPVLLLCDPGVLPAPVLGRAVRETALRGRVLLVDVEAMRRDAPGVAGLLERALSEATTCADDIVFVDLTSRGDRDAAGAKKVLRTAAAAGRARRIVAVGAAAWAEGIEEDADLAEAFRCVWLHDLSDARIPIEL